MIYDRIENISRYRGMSANLDETIDFIEGGGLADIPLGQHEVCGKKVTFNHFQYRADILLDEPLCRFEAHEQHIDLHILFSGQEYIAITPVEAMRPIQTIESEDSIIYGGQVMTKVHLSQNWFILLYPGEGHTGRLVVREDQNHIDKVVFKLSVQN